MAALSNLVSDVPVLGPIAVAASLSTVSSQVLAADPVRRGVIFHNPGSINIRVVPSNLTPVAGSSGILIYPQTEETIFGTDTIHVNSAWNAICDSATTPLTIFNFTDANASVPAPEAVAQLTYQVPIVSPNGIQTSTLGTSSVQIIAANPNRRGILFHNPGPNTVAVCPSNLNAIIGAGSMVILPGDEKRIMATGRIRVNCAWKAIASTGSSNYLTVLEFL